ncbi:MULTISPECIES: transglycosylase domain-containing protein [Allobacillus]|uniref:PBP1A family penicillin-binding protein n=1 Tax=Allobacillus halotolerans TaxID=570278 RepID=A0ABS6GTK3_9BACI|nr:MULTISPECIES: PBP1A family penicillin-binding protein [Allobacillus]MBU6081652.1 PBP1A family penicillin-binding protein [Allobacillus halotolerans]TSJ66357.1 PBP1A family penicillin-binding protein [Allobacillus sp. SKP2-8]
MAFTIKKKWKWALYAILALLVLSVLGYLFILLGGRFVVDEKHFVFSESTVIETEDGEQVMKLYDENRTYVASDQIPDHVKEAFVAIEDRRFYDHSGVDFRSIARAVYTDVVTWSKKEGASTITQQLVKNTSLTNEKSWLRKTKEAMGAIYLERIKSKDEILEYYLNEIYFGHGIYGIEEASQFFFSKSVNELSISEGAMLAALPKAPNTYSPLKDKEKAIERRNLVLSNMYEQDYLTAEELKREQGKTIGLNQSDRQDSPWLNTYIDLVMNEVEKDYHLTKNEILTGGYDITVGIDLAIQETTYHELQKDDYFHGSQENIQAAMVVLDEENGLIRAAHGGRNNNRGDLNRLHVRRQPGSTMKPVIVYGPALEKSIYEPYTLIDDVQRSYGDYRPKNYDGVYEGKVTMYDALIKSKNVAAVDLLNEIGVNYAKDYLENVGIQFEEKGLPIALGGMEEGLTPVQMASLYRTFYDEGRYITPKSVVEVKDRDGNVLERDEDEVKRLFSKQTSWYLTRMLEGVVTEGTASFVDYNKALAGKTGSTQHPHRSGAYKDAWFVGFNTDYTIATWIGYDQSDEEHYMTQGSKAPTQLTTSIFRQLDETHSFPVAFEKPESVNELEKPVRLTKVTDLKANVSVGWRSGIHVKLTWTPSTDERVVYHIYRESGNGPKKIGEVTGEGSYRVNSVKVFQNPSYFVVPVNPQTNVEGEPSNTVTAF